MGNKKPVYQFQRLYDSKPLSLLLCINMIYAIFDKRIYGLTYLLYLIIISSIKYQILIGSLLLQSAFLFLYMLPQQINFRLDTVLIIIVCP